MNSSKVGSWAADAYFAMNQSSAMLVRKEAAVSTFSSSSVDAPDVCVNFEDPGIDDGEGHVLS